MRENSTSTVEKVGGTWKADNVCDEYNVCRRTVSYWQERKIIPFIRVGGVIRFDPVAVRNALKNYEVKAIEPVRRRGKEEKN